MKLDWARFIDRGQVNLDQVDLGQDRLKGQIRVA